MDGISTKFISELQPIHPLENVSLLTITFLAIGLFGFTKTKFYLKDILFVFGLILFAMMAGRNIFFLYLIGSIYLTNMLAECMHTYMGEETVKHCFESMEKSLLVVVVVFYFTSIIAIKNFSYQLVKSYVNPLYYPEGATEWILENMDVKSMRIWNHFNWGSYLEFKGIKVFVDSRSGMYTEQENKGCTVLNDWYLIDTDQVGYEEIFEKYQITHILVRKSERLNHHLIEDEHYHAIYEDDTFILYEKRV